MTMRKIEPDEIHNYPWGLEPIPGMEYIEIEACCGACTEAGKDLPGHFACSGNVDTLLAQGWIEDARCLDGGWTALLHRKRSPAL
jgi:hypothetical protein